MTSPTRPALQTGPTRDSYAAFVGHGVGARLASRVGLPRPVDLRRYDPATPLIPGAVAVLGDGACAAGIVDRIERSGGQRGDDEQRLGGVVVDATSATRVHDLDQVRAALHSTLRRVQPSGRVIILGPDPGQAATIESTAVAQALEGIVRSVGKELRAGATANLVQVQTGADPWPAVSFFLSGRSAYVDGQCLLVAPFHSDIEPASPRPLRGKVAAVTGAARGIGAAIATTLARDGARVLAVDVPTAGESLVGVANEIGGVALQLDITDPRAGERIAEHTDRLGGLDVLVHNAGITRDKLVVNLDASKWAAVLEVNLAAQLRIDDVLLEGPLAADGRVIAVSSVSGIAGNRGQTNYAASKAGVIGMVQARAATLAGTGRTYNAVAPGFIETEMTARMPLGPRELGRRANSLAQGGLPVDVAETIAFFAQPTSGGLNGQLLRVCGQSLLGA